ncbi:NAD(P)/FAD-dependent oxidoreductase [Georgenia sp. SYP-B2076]|uniref:FAD-dependent oxidoreductase n=1 Tax=Georgenia sp. SYP-B2076 TaxID=2495881 RepID=UPI00197AA911|nr:FAD-dependent oxidoreductase [Georgenia sp. SYP-B2076]
MAGHRGRSVPRRVVVIGAGLAGSFAAAAVTGAGRSVTILERDQLPTGPAPRRGVPQGPQPHVFLRRGLLAVEELLPALRDELLAAGAVPIDSGDLAWLGASGWGPSGQREYELISATRPLFEQVVHRRVRALPGVRLSEDARVAGLRRGDDGTPWRVELSDGASVPADLVIDASGRGSRLPVWLEEAGLPRARTSGVDAKVGYASRLYRLDGPPGLAGIVLQQNPETQTGGIALPVEDGGWLVGAVGAGELRPPRDVDGFTAALAGLRDPVLADLVRVAEPLTDVAVHRQTENVRHHYEALRGWPAGLLVLGDALCTFDPVYGQGLTVAACEALALRRALAGGFGTGDERRLLRRFARVAALPWAIATGEDLRFPTSTGRQSAGQALLGRWTRELGRLSTHGDRRAQAALSGVYHLMVPPVALAHPALAAAVVRARLRGYGPPEPRPATLARLSAPG